MKGTSESHRKNAQYPRVRTAAVVDPHPGESMEEAVLRYQRAKASGEEIGAEREALKLRQDRGELIKAEVARDQLEAAHLAWVAELEQMPHLVATGLGEEFTAAMRDLVRARVDQVVLEVRQRIGGG